MSLVKEFKEFAMRGNVVDLAVGIIIGGAFGKIVSSLVGDVIMPPIGLAIGGVNFSDLSIELAAAAADKPAVLLKYGAFIQSVFDFIIVAIAIFAMIKVMNKLKRTTPPPPAAPAAPTEEVLLLREIRDNLRK